MSIAIFNSMRLWKIKTWLLFFAVLTLIVVGLSISFFPIESALWHCTHSSLVSFGKAELKIPVSWWKGSDSGDGSILLEHAAFATTTTSKLRIFPLANEKVKIDDQAASEWQNAFLEASNKGPRKEDRSVEISDSRGRIYCVEDTLTADAKYLNCRVPGLSWGISFEGPTKDEQGAESIIASLRSLD